MILDFSSFSSFDKIKYQCDICNDTRKMFSYRFERFFNCIACPYPCDDCCSRVDTSYCKTTPCNCECHP
jgi:hypothetical protein